MAQAIMGAQILKVKPPITAPTQAQLTSQFLQLPGELRNIIYAFVFSSTCIHHGPQKTKLVPRVTNNPLSLLFTSRQTYHETKDIWLPLVEFSFFYQIPMATKLRELPADVRAQIRQIRMFSSDRLYSDWISTFENILEWNLPDFRPERLTVVGMSLWRACNLTLGPLILDGGVWGEKELEGLGRFVTPATSKNYCFELSWTPKRSVVSPEEEEEKEEENFKVPQVVDAIAERDYEAMKVSLAVYRGGRRLAVFGSGGDGMSSVQRLEGKRSYENSKKKGSWGKLWKRIWNRVKLH